MPTRRSRLNRSSQNSSEKQSNEASQSDFASMIQNALLALDARTVQILEEQKQLRRVLLHILVGNPSPTAAAPVEKASSNDNETTPVPTSTLQTVAICDDDVNDVTRRTPDEENGQREMSEGCFDELPPPRAKLERMQTTHKCSISDKASDEPSSPDSAQSSLKKNSSALGENALTREDPVAPTMATPQPKRVPKAKAKTKAAMPLVA